MNRLLIIVGLFIIVFACIIPLKRNIQEYKVQKNGKLVMVTITYIPNCIGSKIKYFMKFTYEGKEFDKKVGCGFADSHKVGQTIQLKHLDDTDIFLFDNENKEIEFVSTSALAVLGIIFIVIGARRK